MLLSQFVFADKIALHCKPSDYADYVVPIVINTDTKTLKFGSFPSYILNHVSDEYYYAYRIYAEGGEFLIVSRLRARFQIPDSCGLESAYMTNLGQVTIFG